LLIRWQCITDVGVDVVKTGNFLYLHWDVSKVPYLIDEGMLASIETIKAVARALQDHHVMTTVVDPV
jgi:hydroxymethylpyrimidine/phosphomethylpyrimidine kinase / thiaminase